MSKKSQKKGNVPFGMAALVISPGDSGEEGEDVGELRTTWLMGELRVT